MNRSSYFHEISTRNRHALEWFHSNHVLAIDLRTQKKIQSIDNPMFRACSFSPINMTNNGKCYEIAVTFIMIYIFLELIFKINLINT